MSAREELSAEFDYDPCCDFRSDPEERRAEIQQIIDAYAAEVRAEALREAADEIRRARLGFKNDDTAHGMGIAAYILRRMAEGGN